MADSIARSTLNKARYFLSEAKRLDPHQFAFEANFEAALAFGRSVWFHLKKQYARKPSFSVWEKAQKANFSPLFQFLKDAPDIVLHQRQLAVQNVTPLETRIEGHFQVFASLTVTHGTPWYRRGLRTVWNDVGGPVRQFLQTRLKRRSERKRGRAEAPQLGAATVPAVEVYFADPKWNQSPALDLIDQYLNELEKLVDDAEARF